jgi:diacylglycerol kinase
MGLLDKFRKKSPKRIKDTGTALERYEKSFMHAVDGIIYGIRFEHNMIIILIATVLVTIAGLMYKISAYEWLFVITMIGTISASEMINTSIEATIDLVTTDIKPLAKIAKDTASSATLLLCLTALVGAIIIFLPKVMALFGG